MKSRFSLRSKDRVSSRRWSGNAAGRARNGVHWIARSFSFFAAQRITRWRARTKSVRARNVVGGYAMTEHAAGTVGFGHGLTNYGDRDFSLYLRRSFAQSMGYSRALLSKPVVGIAYTPSGFNNCHRH